MSSGILRSEKDQGIYIDRKEREMELFEGMLQRDIDSFKRICNRLLSRCFLCRKNDAEKLDYYFLLKHKEKFGDYLSVLGYRLEINEEYGVVQLTNPEGFNRYGFRLGESVILLILRILYDEKKRELSLGDDIIVTVGDVHDRFAALKIREKMLDRKTLNNAFSTLRRFSIVEVLDSDVTNEESRIIIYDSILMAVRVEDIKGVYEKLEKYRRNGEKDEEAD